MPGRGGLPSRRPDQGYTPPSGWAGQAPRITPTTAPVSADTNLLTNPPASSQAASSTQLLYQGPVTGISYNVSINLFTSASPPAIPFYQVIVEWDDVNGHILSIEHWNGLLTNLSGNCVIFGRGPTKGTTLKVSVKNFDTNPLTIQYFDLNQSTRVCTRDDWRNVNNNMSGSYTYGAFTFTTPVSSPTSLVPGQSSNVVLPGGAGQQGARINGLYAGIIWLSAYIVSGTTPNVNLNVYAVNPEWAAANAYQQLYAATLTGAALAVGPVQLAAPRMPLVVVFTNESGNTATCDYVLVAQEVAS